MCRRTFAAALAALWALALVACSQQSAGITTGPVGGTVVVRLTGPWPTLDPHIQGTTDNIQIDQSIYDWLVYFDGHKIVPYLATKWQQTPTSVQFTLRHDATCADGTPVTPTVVANSLKRVMMTSEQSLLSQATRAFGPGPYSVSADDSAGTVGISVGRPYSGLLYAFSQLTVTSAVICPRGLANPASLATMPNGSGPFKLTSLAQGDTVTTVARPEWQWGPNGHTTKSPGFPQNLVFKVVSNETTAANLLQTGGVDIANINGPDNTRLIADHSLIHKTTQGYSASLLMFVQAAGHPTADQAVRQALATSVDPKAYGKAAYSGFMTPTTSYLAPNADCFDQATRSLVPAPDVAKAKQIMSSAGYQTGTDGTWLDKTRKQMTIVINGGDFQGAGPEYLSSQFTAAGFNVKLATVDRGLFAQRFFRGDWDVEVGEIASPTPDPNGGGNIALYTGPIPPAGNNYLRLDYPSIDAEITAANSSSGAESCKHWAKVQEELLSRYVVIPLGVAQRQVYGHGIDFFADTYYGISPMSLRRVK